MTFIITGVSTAMTVSGPDDGIDSLRAGALL